MYGNLCRETANGVGQGGLSGAAVLCQSQTGRVWGHATGLPSWVGNPRGSAHVVGRSTHARATSAETDGPTDHVLVRAAPEEAPHDPSFCQKKSTLPKEVK